MEFGSVSDARETYVKLGWSVRMIGEHVIVLASGRGVDVLEAPYTAAIVALGRWEREALAGPIATDGATAWFMVRSGRYPWPGSVAARAGAATKARRDVHAVRWHAGTGLPVPPTSGGSARVWWLVQPDERHLPDADGLPHPFDAAERLGQALNSLSDDGRALHIGERSVLVGAPTSARRVSAALAGERHGAARPRAEEAGGEAKDDTKDDAEGKHAGQRTADSEETAVDRPRRLDHPQEESAPAASTQKRKDRPLEVRMSWPGSGSRTVGRMEDLIGLMQRLDSRTDGQGGLVVIEHANGRRLSVGVGAAHSVAIWAQEDAAVPYMISSGDGPAVTTARADADPETGVMYLVPGGRFAFVPPDAAVSGDLARRAVVEFAYSGRRPQCITWSD